MEAEKTVVPELATRVVDGRLIIGPESNSAIHTTGPINYHLTVKDLNSLEVLGTANAEATGIETESLTVTISGAGNVRMEGKADEQAVEISGTGTYLAENLESKEVNIDSRGSRLGDRQRQRRSSTQRSPASDLSNTSATPGSNSP